MKSLECTTFNSFWTKWARDAGATTAENPGSSKNLTKTHPLLLCCSNLATSAHTKPPEARKPLPHCSTAAGLMWQCSWPMSGRVKHVDRGEKHEDAQQSCHYRPAELKKHEYSKSVTKSHIYFQLLLTLSQLISCFTSSVCEAPNNRTPFCQALS